MTSRHVTFLPPSLTWALTTTLVLSLAAEKIVSNPMILPVAPDFPAPMPIPMAAYAPFIAWSPADDAGAEGVMNLLATQLGVRGGGRVCMYVYVNIYTIYMCMLCFLIFQSRSSLALSMCCAANMCLP